jgi:hypothetical protein
VSSTVVVGAVVAVVVGLGFAVVVGLGFGFAVVGGTVVGFAVVGAEVVGGAVGPTVSASSITRTEGIAASVVAPAVVATELTARGDATPVEVVDPDAETRSSLFPPRAAKNTTPRAMTVTSTAAAMRCRSAGVTSRAPPSPGDPNGGRT